VRFFDTVFLIFLFKQKWMEKTIHIIWRNSQNRREKFHHSGFSKIVNFGFREKKTVNFGVVKKKL